MSKAAKLQDWFADYKQKIPTYAECEQFLDELDKPSLDPQHKEILQSLVNRKGCVTNVDDGWWWLHKDKYNVMTSPPVDVLTEAMIDLGLLDVYKIKRLLSGMGRRAFVTDAGVEALKQ